jgi:MFS family permease
MPRNPAEPAAQRAARERRLVAVISAVLFLDTMFYAVIAPLLPGLVHELHMSKLSAGLMTAAYPIGTLVGSIPSGLLAGRVGPRITVCAGLTLLACSTLAFGLVTSAAALDIARFVEGVGGACSWAGGFAWIVDETQAARRGVTIGRALAAAIGGSLFGPVIGTVAASVGRPITFAAVAVAAVLLILLTRTLPTHHVRSDQGLRAVVRVLGKPGAALAMWLVALPAVGSGIINVLGPLRLHQFGADAVVIGATFLAAFAVEAAVAPAVGTISDRRGRLVPVRVGLAGGGIALLCFTLPDTIAGLAILIVLTTAALGTFWAPAMAMLSDVAEAVGLDQALAGALTNLAWAGGQILGAAGGGAVAKLAGDGLPTALAAALCAVTLAGVTLKSTARGRATLPINE